MLEARLGDGFEAKGITDLKAQGFTINSSTGKFFSARLNKNNDVTMTRVISSGDQKGKIDAKCEKQKIGHANDCAYYTGRIYIAPQNGKKVIYSYETSLNPNTQKEHPYEGINFPHDSFTQIALIPGGGGWFILGSGEYYVCAYLYGNKFVGISKFSYQKKKIESLIARDKNDGEISGQGIYVQNCGLYKVFSHHNANDYGVITRNDIVSFALSNVYPSYSEITYCNHFACDKDLAFFEVEGLSGYDGTKYISATTKTSDGDSNRFYKVTF